MTYKLNELEKKPCRASSGITWRENIIRWNVLWQFSETSVIMKVNWPNEAHATNVCQSIHLSQWCVTAKLFWRSTSAFRKELCISDQSSFQLLLPPFSQFWKHCSIRALLLFCPWHCVIQQKLLAQTGTQFDLHWPDIHTPSQTMST